MAGHELLWGGVRVEWLLVAGLAALIVAWLVLNLALEQAGIVVLSQWAQYSVVTTGKLDKVLGALLLFLLAVDREKLRLRWIGIGFLILLLGGYADNFLGSLLGGANGPNAQMYNRLVVWTVAYALFVVGFFWKRPLLSWQWALGILVAFGILETIAVAAVDSLPPLTTIARRDHVTDLFTSAPLPGLTSWYFALSLIPLGLAVAAAVGAARRGGNEALGGWMMVAMVLLAGAQLHHLFWPLPHGPVLTSVTLLNLAFGGTVVLGGILELRRIAAERGEMLAAEQKYSSRLRELASLKADFTAMVAHELVSPLAAIRGYADMLATGNLPPKRRARILQRLEAETDMLDALIADVRSAAVVERGDFTVRMRPVALDGLLVDAAATVEALHDKHRISVRAATGKRVWADAERLGQVLRNLLLNAARHTPEGTKIELTATETAGPGVERLRIEVADHGPGIHPEDLDRIFEKFGRGRPATNENGRNGAPGTGLGLYLSKRIVQAHGGELTVVSVPGEGSVFAFELEVAPQ